jgi:hypothetical protein
MERKMSYKLRSWSATPTIPLHGIQFWDLRDWMLDNDLIQRDGLYNHRSLEKVWEAIRPYLAQKIIKTINEDPKIIELAITALREKGA